MQLVMKLTNRRHVDCKSNYLLFSLFNIESHKLTQMTKDLINSIRQVLPSIFNAQHSVMKPLFNLLRMKH